MAPKSQWSDILSIHTKTKKQIIGNPKIRIGIKVKVTRIRIRM